MSLGRIHSTYLRQNIGHIRPGVVRRCISTSYEEKYGEKLKRRLDEEGLRSVSELKAKLVERTKSPEVVGQPMRPSVAGSTPNEAPAKPIVKERKDSSPVKPLSSILNLSKLFSTPHTPEQITALWTAYHASKPGCLSAVIPTETYERMITSAKLYPSFVLPLERTIPPDQAPADATTAVEKKAHEFFYLEWGFHPPPPDPRSDPAFLFDLPPATSSTPPTDQMNPHTSSLLFTPLAEYKIRQSFATPFLVLTHYTDLARSHGVVLLRGDRTPSTTQGNEGKFSMSLTDAQVLSLLVQKFWLGTEESQRGRELLETFHIQPKEFKWEELIEYANLGVPT
ncbi:ATP11-domain-containing protein [Sistotremastrum niveocremeum HHB9708]|uniref:ATP11-domain-containing protein n=1 Tax=Sistotremastrum niveocremeum HHB9708 TaxID=1314777 RepID=A0A164R5W5_9AGAM|nr:ATP11-domain-containing protein [Sistotremastrum niveocremeum HHB9708]